MNIFLSPKAEERLQLIIDNILENWNKKVLNDFIEKLDKKFIQISKFPKSCPKSSKKNIYKCVLSKHNAFYYRLHKNEIEILTFFYNKQNPKSYFK